MKTDLFQSCGHCWVFQICWHIECSIFTASSFRIWNSSTGIPSPPVALFVVTLPKPHLTSHSRMWILGEWSHHHDYLGCEDLFLYSSCVYSCHLFLISSASFRSLPFLSFIVTIFAWSVPLVSLIFLKRSLVFPILLFSSISLLDHWGRISYCSLLFLGTLYSNGYVFPFLLCLSASLLFTAICKASSDNHLAFLWPLPEGIYLSWPFHALECCRGGGYHAEPVQKL